VSGRRVRIAYLLESTALSGGVQVVLVQAEALARRGHRVTVVSPDAPPSWFDLTRARFERSAFTDSPALSRAEIRVATFWTTVAPALSGAAGPVFHLSQGYEAAFRFYADRRDRIEEAYRAPTRKLAVSASLAAKLEALGFGPVENVGQAFEARGFHPGPPRDPDVPVVLLVGPHDADVKGVDVGMAGLALWRARGGRFRLRRVATTPPAPSESSSGLVDEYHLAVPPERMPFVYRSSDLFLGPFREEEGFGLPTLEALASGLSCLLSDTPGNLEIAGPDGARFFRDGDPESLARELPAALGEPARRLARTAGPGIASRYSPEAVAERLEQAFARAGAAVR
jgi:glycosyltransferase involved in cell wall biosynthesis